MQQIPLDDEIRKFWVHLENNPRVVFSASFGDGKTTFLKEMEKAFAADYFFITLHPVNYSVAKNEDVFEYVKRDILLQLANHDKLDGVDLNAAIDSIFGWETLHDAIDFVMQFVPNGNILMKIVEKVKACRDEYEEKKKTWESYESTLKSQRGGLYEDDGYTQLIKAALEYVKSHEEKRTCLIIEDLDRIDPGHLFRILNVFGAHVDEDKDSNKFGFDNIIAVMDYDITEHIFHHFYGLHANYNGYMSNFYSHYPYYYSIKDVAVNNLKQMIGRYTSFRGDRIFDINITGIGGNRLKFGDYVSSLSVRNIASALDGIENQIDRNAVVIDNRNIQTEAPVLYFLAILKLLKAPVKMQTLISSFSSGEDALRILGNFLCCTATVISGVTFRQGSNYYQVQFNENGKLEVFLTGCPYINNLEQNNVAETALIEATKCIKDWNYK